MFLRFEINVGLSDDSGRGGYEMKFKQLEWLADFVFMFVFFFAGNALVELRAARQPLAWLVIEAEVAAAFFSLLNYIRKRGGG